MEMSEGLESRQDETEQRPANETWRPQGEQANPVKSREDRRMYFEANFKYGSTTVLRHNSEFFFRGHIRHCGTDNIFFNARKIKCMMQANGQTMGHMNYNDPPTFSSQWDWEREEQERKKIYQDDLYKFVGDEIVVADLIGAEPIGHIFKDESSDSGHAAEPVAQKVVVIDTPARW